MDLNEWKEYLKQDWLAVLAFTVFLAILCFA